MSPNTPDPHSAEEQRSRTDSEQIIQALKDGKNKRVRKHLLRVHAAKLAALLESLDAEHRRLPEAKRRDADSGVAFSLLTFFWRSKRK